MIFGALFSASLVDGKRHLPLQLVHRYVGERTADAFHGGKATFALHVEPFQSFQILGGNDSRNANTSLLYRYSGPPLSYEIQDLAPGNWNLCCFHA